MTAVSGTTLNEDGHLEEATIYLSRGTIDRVRLGPLDHGDAAEPVRLPEGHILAPGFVDLHCHGGFGVDFPTSDAGSAREAISRIHQTGTTTLLASLVTAAPAALVAGAERFAALAEAGLIAGIHLEGPFLSSVRCGAQNPDRTG
ncbi:amidohydrolase family protein [uncultured Arthrobacter sp.]|uniref:amidohydrolase family protein n=1 Tax=uncultured Arthrobacter sp. TaxID=114050 RepID=UPI00262BB787|nr:amidohydrolase family protein [uncultured Arthrobacter sp.]